MKYFPSICSAGLWDDMNIYKELYFSVIIYIIQEKIQRRKSNGLLSVPSLMCLHSIWLTAIKMIISMLFLCRDIKQYYHGPLQES